MSEKDIGGIVLAGMLDSIAVVTARNIMGIMHAKIPADEQRALIERAVISAIKLAMRVRGAFERRHKAKS